MNFRFLIKSLSVLLTVIAVFMLIPAGLAVYYGEKVPLIWFLTVSVSTIVLSSVVMMAGRNWTFPRLAAKESFLMVTLGWVLASGLGALPFYLSGSIPSFSDAFFETASGFTTTGASILSSIETLPYSMLFWRSLTHWLGGMGIVVLTVAILPMLGVGGIQLLKAEAPGPSVDKIAPRIAETAKVLWFIYLGMTAVMVILLRLGGMNYFDAFTHTFGTVATGGYSPKNTSVAFYNSAYIDYIITTFMVLAGMNFTIHYRFLTGRTKNIFNNLEMKTYFAIIAVTTLISTFNLYRSSYSTISESFRFASFQVASIITTTGFATADYEKWPHLSQFLLFLLMFIGACSGSTGGGIKVIRIATLFKLGLNEMKYLLHPKAVLPLWVEGKVVKKDMVYSIASLVFLYALTVLGTTLVCASSGTDVLTSFTASLSAVGNIGPGFGNVGPVDNYSFFPDYVKWTLSLAMIIGRLEIFTVLIIFTRSFWTK